MTSLQIISIVIVAIGGIIFLIGISSSIYNALKRQLIAENAPLKGIPSHGVLWAFTLGMSPFSKQSARIHWKAYLRGVFQHLCLFLGIGYLLVSPLSAYSPQWLRVSLCAVFATGAIILLAGIIIRLRDPALKSISIPDDYFAIVICAIFLGSASASAIKSELLPVFWIISGVILAYAPFGKLKHFIYFFFERILIGSIFGRRQVLE